MPYGVTFLFLGASSFPSSSLFPSFPSSSLPGAVEGEPQCPFQPAEIGFINLTGVTLEEARATTGNTLLDTAAAFLEKLLQDGGNVTQDGDTLEALSQISTELQKRNEELASCRTNRLWLQYMNMDEILQHSIKAERTGNFLLHLQCVKEMLPYFAASGLNNYLQSDRMYLQQMLELEESRSRDS